MTDHTNRDDDPTLVRNQPALRGSGRARWLVPGGGLAAIAIVVLVLELDLQFALALSGIIALVLLYAGMVLTSVVVNDARRRSYTLAWLMGAIALTGLLVVLAVLVVESA